MIKYSCDSFRPIRIDSDAFVEVRPHQIFARRIARQEFGRRGVVGALRVDGWAEDKSYTHYEAFVGVPIGNGGVSGRNVRFTVYREVLP